MTFAIEMMSIPKALGFRNRTVARIVRLALAEDIGPGDVTSALFSGKEQAVAHFLAKQDGVLSGTIAAKAVFLQLSRSSSVRFFKQDGDRFKAGETLGQVS